MANYIIIPARINKTGRFPKKLLTKINGKTILEITYTNCYDAKKVSGNFIDNVFIATDSTEIEKLATSFGAKVIFTDKADSGSERVAYACHHLINPEIIINVQAEWYDINWEVIKLTGSVKSQADVATCYYITNDLTIIKNPNRIKMIVNQTGRAQYFSRAIIPYKATTALIHCGIYIYNVDFLMNYLSYCSNRKHKKSGFFSSEKLEQLSWLFNGFIIHTCDVQMCHSIDTKEDLDAAIIRQRKATFSETM